MERDIPSQDKEAINQFLPRCFPERHSPFPEWLISPLEQMPGGSMTEEAERIMFCVCSAGYCMVVGEWSAPCVLGINTAWVNFFFFFFLWLQEMRIEGFSHWYWTNSAGTRAFITHPSVVWQQRRMFKCKRKKFVLEMENLCLCWKIFGYKTRKVKEADSTVKLWRFLSHKLWQCIVREFRSGSFQMLVTAFVHIV